MKQRKLNITTLKSQHDFKKGMRDILLSLINTEFTTGRARKQIEIKLALLNDVEYSF